LLLITRSFKDLQTQLTVPTLLTASSSRVVIRLLSNSVPSALALFFLYLIC
jgi:hypothetical protein